MNRLQWFGTLGLWGLGACTKGVGEEPALPTVGSDTAETVPPDDTTPAEDGGANDAESGIAPPEDTSDSASSSEHPLDSGTPHADTGTAPDDGRWTSALFPDDWEVGFAVDVGDGGPLAQLQDYSFAGYKAGEVAVPEAATFALETAMSVVDFGADATGTADATASIQAAIDAVADAGGGLVFFPAGDYRIDGLLTVQQSGTVLLGDSAETTRLSFTKSADMTGVNHLQFSGNRYADESFFLTEDVRLGDVVLPVASVDGLSPGDTVGVGMVITPEWVDAHGMDGYWAFSLGERRTLFQRTVVAVDPDPSRPTITIDVPVRYPMQVRDAADVRREYGYITDCGITQLSLSSAVGWVEAWSNDRSHVLGFKNAQDCWATHLQSWPGLVGDDEHHLQSGGILVDDSRRVTVSNSTMEYAQNRGGGGNGYLFEIKRSDEVLIHSSVGRAGRHNFIQNWDFGSTGNVFLETLSEMGESWTDSSGFFAPTGLSEYHHALAMANLVDSSVAHDGWAAKNRLSWSSGAGHTSTECVFWNMSGTGELVSLQYGRGYVIGTEDLSVRTEVLDFYDSAGTAPEDWVEGLGEGALLQPQSLYREQLRRRGFAPTH